MGTTIRVLVVEDHQVTLDGLTLGLKSKDDIEIAGTATTSDEGLRLAKELLPDVVLLDLHLPGSLGPKSMIKEFCGLSPVRVIVFSGETRPAFIHTVLQMGAVGYLLKSESVSRVLEAIRQAVDGKRPIISEELQEGNFKITRSEEEVLKALARGMKYQSIAELRTTSPATVRKQCELLLLKLGLSSREELIAWAVRQGYGGVELGV